MFHATQFCALTTVDTWLFNNHPGLIDKARNRIFFDRKIRNPPGMNDVGGGNQKPDFGVGRYDERTINLELVILAFLHTVTDLLT